MTLKTTYLVLIFLAFSFQIISFSEAITQRGTVKKLLLNISRNTCTRVFFLIKLQTEACNFSKMETCAGVSGEFWEIFKNTFFYRTLSVAASIMQTFILFI